MRALGAKSRAGPGPPARAAAAAAAAGARLAEGRGLPLGAGAAVPVSRAPLPRGPRSRGHLRAVGSRRDPGRGRHGGAPRLPCRVRGKVGGGRKTLFLQKCSWLSSCPGAAASMDAR